MKLKTTFWKTKDIQQWKYNYQTLAWLLAMNTTINILYHIIVTQNILYITINGCFLILALLIYFSYLKHKKEENKEKQ